LSEAEETKDFGKVVDWFKQREWSHAAHKNNPTESSDHEGNAQARATPDQSKGNDKEKQQEERKKRPRVTDGAALARVWKSVADLFTISSEQLVQLLDAVPGKYNFLCLIYEIIIGPEWRTQVYLSGVGRVHDYKNYDFIKHAAKYPEVMQALYS
jgi:hypothetical protein